MNKIFQGTLYLKTAFVATTLMASTHISANDIDSASEKQWSVGIGAYAFSLSNDDDPDNSTDFTGYNLSAGYAINNHFQIRGTYFSLENDDVSDIETTGFDLMAYGGTGLSEKGFRGYGGAGYFSDKWDLYEFEETFSGIQLGGGVGYNWGPTALDLVISLRQADKYEDLLFAPGTYFAVSGNLTISYLF